MDVEYTGRQTIVTKTLKLQIEAGLTRIEKIAGHSGRVQVTLTTDKYRQIAEIKVHTKSLKLVVVCEAAEMEAAVRDALTKIEQQAIRYKKKTATIKRHPQRDVKNVARKTAVDSSIPPAVKGTAAKVSAKSSAGRKTVPMLVHSFPLRVPLSEPHVVRSSDGVALRPMSIEEALKEAAFRDRDVFVFRDYKGQAMVLHRKRDGRVELIEVP